MSTIALYTHIGIYTTKKKKKKLSHFADFEQVRIEISHFADFEQVK